MYIDYSAWLCCVAQWQKHIAVQSQRSFCAKPKPQQPFQGESAISHNSRTTEVDLIDIDVHMCSFLQGLLKLSIIAKKIVSSSQHNPRMLLCLWCKRRPNASNRPQRLLPPPALDRSHRLASIVQLPHRLLCTRWLIVDFGTSMSCPLRKVIVVNFCSPRPVDCQPTPTDRLLLARHGSHDLWTRFWVWHWICHGVWNNEGQQDQEPDHWRRADQRWNLSWLENPGETQHRRRVRPGFWGGQVMSLSSLSNFV